MTTLQHERHIDVGVSGGVRGWTVALGIGALLQGLWAFGWPGDFYDRFPVEGAGWVSTLGPFNEHLTTDVGAALIGMGTAAIYSARHVSSAGLAAVTAGFAVFGAAHLAFHLGELHHFEAGSVAAQLFSLLLLVVWPAGLFAAVRVGRSAR